VKVEGGWIYLRPFTALLAQRNIHLIPSHMNALTWFGLFAVTAMLVTYALERKSVWFILAFAVSCVMGSAYGFLQGAWPFGIVEAIWSVVAVRRWWLEKSARA
jgi:TctA family transporter